VAVRAAARLAAACLAVRAAARLAACLDAFAR
jgi:hypothetical protein